MQLFEKEGVLARNVTEEKELIEGLFQGFIFNEDTGVFFAKTNKVIIEFIFERLFLKENIEFHCPQNLKEQFI